MKPTSLPKYFELNQVLNSTTLKLHPSQTHGLICGIICGNLNSHVAWEELIVGDKSSEKVHETLHQLYDASSQLLREFLFDFKLILPVDSQPLPARAEALTLWCQGFLTGLKLVNIPIVDREPSEVTEAINDIIEIAKMNYEEVVASEEDEAAYTELVEFIRMAIILIYQDLHEDNAESALSSSGQLH